MTKNKHLTIEDRSQLEHMLRGGNSLSEIAERLGKNRSTISREIKKYRKDSSKSACLTDSEQVYSAWRLYEELCMCKICVELYQNALPVMQKMQ